MKENPALKVVLPKRKKYRCEIYDDVQIRQLLESVKGTDLELAVELEIAIGLRRGELLRLKFSQIDFEKKTLTVSENIDYMEKKLRNGQQFHDTDLVFCKENGQAYNADYFSEKFCQSILM